MASGSDSYHSLPWGWLEWLFGTGHEPKKPVRFSDDVLAFLTHPIEFRDEFGNPVFVVISRIELIENMYDQEYFFDFAISSQPPPAGHNPQLGKREPAGIERTVVRYHQPYREAPRLGYTFSSLNSLEQNRDNLREFVFMQRDLGDADDVVIQQPGTSI